MCKDRNGSLHSVIRFDMPNDNSNGKENIFYQNLIKLFYEVSITEKLFKRF